MSRSQASTVSCSTAAKPRDDAPWVEKSLMTALHSGSRVEDEQQHHQEAPCSDDELPHLTPRKEARRSICSFLSASSTAKSILQPNAL